jgi:polyisoprenoid-binding protein YceI
MTADHRVVSMYMTIDTTQLRPGRWAIDPAHSHVGFTVRHLGVAKVRGRFTCFDVDVVVGETLAASSVTATVDLASIDTGNPVRDADVRAPDILDVARRPSMTFRSTSIRGEAPGFVLDGRLSIGDVTRPFTLALTFGGIQEVPGGGPRHAGFEAHGELRRSDFRIGPGIPTTIIGDVIKVELDIELVEPAA